jgi:hypothetical protein
VTAPLLYTAELDLDEADIEPFLHWYAYRHAPDVYQVGFQSCTCYRVLGGDMNLFDLYELPAWDLFETPRYLGMRGRDPMDALMTKRRNKAHTVYDQHLIAPDATGPCLDADWIAVFRFAVPDEADEVIVDLLTRHQPLLAASGLKRIRFATRGEDHPRNPTFRPRCMIVAECDTRPTEDFLGIPDLLFDAAGDTIEDDSAFIGQRVYPWMDNPG